MKELAARNGIQMPEDELLLEANKWELSHGGKSGRTAQQFIDYLLGITTIKGRFPKDMKEEVIEKYNIDLYLVKRLREKGTFQDLQKDKSTAPSP